MLHAVYSGRGGKHRRFDSPREMGQRQRTHRDDKTAYEHVSQARVGDLNGEFVNCM